ncbi:transcriptional repressor TCF25-domain-containing protein [Crepidotus variabilis]|uniref:Transcriptional repressor TCF25-domain-containing protein n=1 Tax=Crepidotus variabilis TaxID=179855 RepID=A0A9P6EL81_9AGAR|nr:transcriptional repressor TCF25-domain-containing protein [Crepidotus variabilis]
MPPRLNKRQQRELEELEALHIAKPEAPSDDENEFVPVRHVGGGGFSSLAMSDQHSGDEDEEEEANSAKSKKSKKKKKKSSQAAISQEGTTPTEFPKEAPKPSRSFVPPPPKNEKKAAKKARAKESKAANETLDQVLAELSVQYPASQRVSQSVTGKDALGDLFSVSLQHLDSEAEMKRFFGSKVVQASKAGESSKGRKAPTVKSHLTRPQPTWWAAKGREGLSLRQYTDDEVNAKLSRNSWSPIQEKWWTVEYSKRYKSVTKAFMGAVMAGDPQALFDMLGVLPWHADTLLQISEVYHHREEHAQAIDFIDRALFTYEGCMLGAFNFTSGLNRLDFDRIENRPFFLALHRQIADLQRRGCVRTAFEFARLLFALDPWNDPHGSTFHLDFLAIKAGMHQWFLDAYNVFQERSSSSGGKSESRLNPSYLPGWSYARALALKILEDLNKDADHQNSREALQQAAKDFPSIVPLLADKLDVSFSASIRSHRDFKIETDCHSLTAPNAALHLLSHLFVQRSSPVWKEHVSWFSSTISATFSNLPSSLPVTDRRRSFLDQFENVHLRYSVYRHVMVLESSYRRLFSFIPRQILDAKSLSCDPLPPVSSISLYDDNFFQGIEQLSNPRRSRQQRAMDERLLAQLLPDPGFRQQFQAFFDAHPQFAQRFPGGVVQFAQMAAQMQPELLEDLMLAQAMDAEAPGGQGGMPGGFGDIDDREEQAGGRPAAPPDNIVEVIFNPPPPNAQRQPEVAPVPVPVAPAGEMEDILDNSDAEESEDDEDDVSPMPRVLRNIFGRFFGQQTTTHEEESSSDEEGVTRDNMGVD